MSAHSHHSDTHQELGHIIEPKTFRKVLFTLFFLTFITVAVAPSVTKEFGITAFDFGSFNVVIAMFIASIKATLVLLIFMHLKYENKITVMYLIFPIFLIFCMMAGIFIDNPLRRAMLPVKEEKGKVIAAESYAQSAEEEVSQGSTEEHHEKVETHKAH